MFYYFAFRTTYQLERFHKFHKMNLMNMFEDQKNKLLILSVWCYFFCPWVSFRWQRWHVPRLVRLCLIGFGVGFSRSPDLGLKMHQMKKNRHIKMFFLGRYFKIATQLLFHFGWPGHTRPILARNRMVRYFGCGANRVKLEPPVRKSPIQNCAAWMMSLSLDDHRSLHMCTCGCIWIWG